MGEQTYMISRSRGVGEAGGKSGMGAVKKRLW